METIDIMIDKTNWQFLLKEEDKTCEIINTKTKEEKKGIVKTLSSNGRYTVEITGDI